MGRRVSLIPEAFWSQLSSLGPQDLIFVDFQRVKPRKSHHLVTELAFIPSQARASTKRTIAS